VKFAILYITELWPLWYMHYAISRINKTL